MSASLPPEADHASRSIQLSVVAPCFNEQDNIAAFCARVETALDRVGISFEIVLVDDGSSDQTWVEIQREAEARPRVVVGVQHSRNLGMFQAWITALAHASADTVALIDADLQNPPESLVTLWREFTAGGANIVQGTRSSIERDRDSRYLVSRGLNWMLNVAYSDDATDNKSGFVIAPREILEDVLTLRGDYRYPQTFIRVAARAKGYKVTEVETLFQPRRSGESFLSAVPSTRIYADVLADVGRGLGEFRPGRRHVADSIVTPLRGGPAADRQAHGSRARGLLRNAYFATMPAHAWNIRPRTKAIYERLTETQWLTPTELEELQVRRLRRLMWHAYTRVPYYRRAFAEYGLHPREVTSVADLARFPMLSKGDVSANLYLDLFSDSHRKSEMHKIATSGSTGHPFVTYADREQLEVRFATTLRAMEWTGWRFGDKQVRLWHQSLGMSPTQVGRERLDAAMLRRTFIPAFELTEAGLVDLAKRLNRIRPVLIDGYAESLNFLAVYLAQGGLLDFRPRAVMSSAQVLTAGTRRQIEDSLGAPVYDKYGAREFSGIAYQCGEGDEHHIMDESYVVEILVEGRRAKPGELGEVVITDLNNFSVPLIRYRIGDLAIAGQSGIACSCGRGLSRLGEIQGRTQALVHCANGRWLPGTFFAHFFKEYDYLVAFFQVIQHERGAFELKIVRGGQWSLAEWRRLMDDLREYVGDTDVNVEYVEEIPLLATGKRTPVVSHVRVDFQSL